MAASSLDVPWADLDAQHQRLVLHGSGESWIPLNVASRERQRPEKPKKSPIADTGSPTFQYKGVMTALNEAARVSFTYRHRLDYLVSDVPCSKCQGSRLRDDAAACRFLDHAIGDICALGRSGKRSPSSAISTCPRSSSKSPAWCCARSRAACSSSSMSGSIM